MTNTFDMKIKMLKDLTLIGGNAQELVFLSNKIYDIPPALAKDLILQKYAEGWER